MKLGERIKIVRGENWVISRYEEYLLDRKPDAEHVALIQLTSRPQRSRVGHWSASSTGTCMRAQQFTFLGMPQRDHKETLLNVFAGGEYMHLKGTMDAVLSSGEGLELKSINTWGFGNVCSFGPKPAHRLQVHAYMLATGMESFRVLYEDKNTNLMKEFIVPREEKLIREISEDLEKLAEYSAQRRLVPMLQECKNETGRFISCPYAPICEEADWSA